jgi:hypothetical protein
MDKVFVHLDNEPMPTGQRDIGTRLLSPFKDRLTLILSTTPHHERFIVIGRECNSLTKVTWMKFIRDCMRKLQGFEFVRDPLFEHLDV